MSEHLEGHKEYLTFRLCDEEYAIDILQVREIRAHEAVTRIAQAPRYVKGVINLRGAIVPIIDLRARFGLPPVAESSTVVIIVSLGERLTGVVADGVCDVVALMPGQVRPAPALRGAIDASFIVGIAPIDGRMLIVADVATLVAPGEEPELQAA
ncbi:MAG TPA: chemotaxis protein CheW [Usitatibacter sp.]|nr:chemotaxis protein CheW [Usitatibacter sp.]